MSDQWTATIAKKGIVHNRFDGASECALLWKVIAPDGREIRVEQYASERVADDPELFGFMERQAIQCAMEFVSDV